MRYKRSLCFYLVCKILNKGVVAIFGPQSTESRAIVRSICDTMGIPHLETEPSNSVRSNGYSVNLYPLQETLSRVFNDLILEWRWKNFTVIFDGAEGKPHLLVKDTNYTTYLVCNQFNKNVASVWLWSFNSFKNEYITYLRFANYKYRFDEDKKYSGIAWREVRQTH